MLSAVSILTPCYLLRLQALEDQFRDREKHHNQRSRFKSSSRDRSVQDLEQRLSSIVQSNCERLENVNEVLKSLENKRRLELRTEVQHELRLLQRQQQPSALVGSPSHSSPAECSAATTLNLSWYLSAEHLGRCGGLCSSDFVFNGLGFEFELTAPSPDDGWRGFCVRTNNRRGSGLMTLKLSYWVRLCAPDEVLLLEPMFCNEALYDKREDRSNWGFRRFLQHGSQAYRSAIAAGGIKLLIDLRSLPTLAADDLLLAESPAASEHSRRHLSVQ